MKIKQYILNNQINTSEKNVTRTQNELNSTSNNLLKEKRKEKNFKIKMKD